MLTIEEILSFMREYGPAKTVATYQFMVVQSGDPLLIYQFMKNIPGCDKTLLRQIISDFLYYDQNVKVVMNYYLIKKCMQNIKREKLINHMI